MTSIQRAGGFAALFIAASYVVGLTMYGTLLNPTDADTPAKQLAYLAEHQTALLIMTIIIYLGAGVALVPLSLAVHDRLKTASSWPMQTATVFGLIWAAILLASGMIYNIGVRNVLELTETLPDQAASSWVAIEAVSDGLGGGSELVGSVWVLLLSLAALRSRRLSRGLIYLGLLVAGAGILTVVPALSVFRYVFGIAQIPWFVWLGVTMLRRNRSDEPVGP